MTAAGNRLAMVDRWQPEHAQLRRLEPPGPGPEALGNLGTVVFDAADNVVATLERAPQSYHRSAYDALNRPFQVQDAMATGDRSLRQGE